MLSLISDAAKEAFPSTKQTDLFPYHRVLCHRPQGLSCCSHPPQDRLLPRHSCQENSCLDLHAEMLSSSAVPTKLHLLACQPRTVTSTKGENRKKKGQKLLCIQRWGLKWSPYTFCRAASSSRSIRLSGNSSSSCRATASSPLAFSDSPDPRTLKNCWGNAYTEVQGKLWNVF